MAKFNGFGGGFGGGNMNQMMMQARKMQQDLQKAQEEIAETEVVGSAGGVVEVVLTGDRRVVSVTIEPEAVDPDDVEMLEDLIVAAFNSAMEEVDKLSEEKLGPMAGMLGGLR